MCMVPQRLKMGIPQQAPGRLTNQGAERGSDDSDWVLGHPVVMMMGIRSWLWGLYPGACTLKKSMDEEAGAQSSSRKNKQQ